MYFFCKFANLISYEMLRETFRDEKYFIMFVWVLRILRP